MQRFLRKPTGNREPLAVTMSGVRMGERVLQIGINDPLLAAAIAAKVGLSGHAVMAVATTDAAGRAARGAAAIGALIDVQVTPLQALPFPGNSFDVVVINNVDSMLAAMDETTRTGVARESHRVLRAGGRVIVIEAGARTGLSALLRPSPKPDERYEATGGSIGAMQGGGFKPVRLLAEREGYRFIEGLKT